MKISTISNIVSKKGKIIVYESKFKPREIFIHQKIQVYFEY